MSGRSLGYTGGTIDKLESIPGYKVNIPIDDFIKQVSEIKVCISTTTENLAPADKNICIKRCDWNCIFKITYCSKYNE